MSDNTESDSYRTIAAPATGVYKEKGSKFLAFAYPVSAEEEVKVRVREIKKVYFDARHHCFAYRLGAGGELWRANDDGEPSFTAGKPILGQLLSYNVSDTLIVVVRYFGGVKLGVSGLINAYRQAAADALTKSTIKNKYTQEHIVIHFPYFQMNVAMKLLKESPATITEQQFGADCRIVLSIRRTLFPTLSAKLSQIDNLIITR